MLENFVDVCLRSITTSKKSALVEAADIAAEVGKTGKQAADSELVFRGVVKGRSNAEWICSQKVVYDSSLRFLSRDEDSVFSVQQLVQLSEVIS